MDNREIYYSIGQFAELCNVTPKQLRYYDEHGILSPSMRDDESGYRFYEKSQMQEILLLKELQKMNFPLSEIAKILKTRNINLLRLKLNQGVAAARLELDDALMRYNHAIDMMMRANEAMEALIQSRSNSLPVHEISLVQYPERWLVYNRYVSPWNVNQLFTERRMEIYKLVEKYGLEATGVISAVFHGGYYRQFSDAPEDQQGDLEVFQPVESVGDCPNSRKQKPFQALTTLHVGPYPSLKQAYDQINEYASINHIELMDKSIEEYIFGTPHTRDQSQYLTRVYVPLKGSDI